MISKRKEEDVKSQTSLMEGNNETANQEDNMEDEARIVTKNAEVKGKSERPETIIRQFESDEERAEYVLSMFSVHYEEPRKAFEAADRAFCEARVKCGEVVFEYMFDNDTSRIGPKKYDPVYPISYKLLLSMKGMPVKSKTAMRNLVYLGYQSVWLSENGVDLGRLMEAGKLGYTHLVRLSEMPSDDRKLELTREIANREKPLSVKELEAEIKKKLKKEIQFPPDFEQVMATGWMPQVITEKIAQVTAGIEINEETTRRVLSKFFSDLKTVAEHGYEKEKGILVTRGEEMADTLRKAQEKAQGYLKYINTALRKIEENKPEKKRNRAA